MALDRFSWPIVEQTKELTQRGELFYIERLMAEVNTRGTVVTPTLVLEDLVVTLPTFSTTTRDHIDVAIDRIGSFSRLELSPVAGIQWYMTEVVIRPLQLGVALLPQGGRQRFPGRSDDVSTFLQFDVKPFSVPSDARLQCAIVQRVYLDLVTGGESVDIVLEYADGSSQSITGISRSTRGVEEFSILNPERLVAVRLEGDFTNSDIVIYDIEVDVYVPGKVGVGAG